MTKSEGWLSLLVSFKRKASSSMKSNAGSELTEDYVSEQAHVSDGNEETNRKASFRRVG